MLEELNDDDEHDEHEHHDVHQWNFEFDRTNDMDLVDEKFIPNHFGEKRLK